MRRKLLGVVVILTGFSLLLGAAPGSQAYVISAAKHGGDCTKIGTWNAKTKTCTLDRDISALESRETFSGNGGWGAVIKIGSNGVTLDGNGHTLSFPPFTQYYDGRTGIIVLKKNGVTIRNIAVTGFSANYGIYVEGAPKSPVKDLVISNVSAEDCYSEIHMIYLDKALISDSRFGSESEASDGYAIELYHSSRVALNSNTFAGGLSSTVFLQNVSRGSFAGNSFTSLYCYGNCDQNLIRGNSFIGKLQRPRGLFFRSGSGNTLRDNTFEWARANFLGEGGNVIYHNNFISHWFPQPGPHSPPLDPELANIPGSCFWCTTSSPNTLNRPAPIGGNYYNWYDEEKEGCADANGDGFCDAPWVMPQGYDEAANTDELPYTRPNGWLP